ncbi:hypothetical protein [Nocardiopsis eucommiae]|uniref:hypothetical protein n=1 Tax=Nocardiopsis eucommiae TaxID=2831970 RepID=UPI003D702916
MTIEELVLVGTRLHERSLRPGEVPRITPATVLMRVYDFGGTVLARDLVVDTLVDLHVQGLVSPPRMGSSEMVVSVGGLTEAGRERADYLISEADEAPGRP